MKNLIVFFVFLVISHSAFSAEPTTYKIESVYCDSVTAIFENEVCIVEVANSIEAFTVIVSYEDAMEYAYNSDDLVHRKIYIYTPGLKRVSKGQLSELKGLYNRKQKVFTLQKKYFSVEAVNE